MSDPNPPPNPLTFSDRDLAIALFKDFHDCYRRYLSDYSAMVDRNFEVNKQVAAFYERIMLLDLGTIALSVTALISLVPRFSSSQVPRHTFLWYVVPAWALLLISTIACRIIIQKTVAANITFYKKWSDSVFKYNAGVISVQVKKISQAVNGTVSVNSQDVDFAQTLSALGESLLKATSEEPPKSEDIANTAPIWVGVAVSTAQIGLVLLCISAVKLLLSL